MIWLYIFVYADFNKYSYFSTGPPTGPRPGLDRASTGPRLGLVQAMLGGQWSKSYEFKNHKLARYQKRRRSRVSSTSSEDVSSEDISSNDISLQGMSKLRTQRSTRVCCNIWQAYDTLKTKNGLPTDSLCMLQDVLSCHVCCLCPQQKNMSARAEDKAKRTKK